MKNSLKYILIAISIFLSYLMLGYFVNDYNQEEIRLKEAEIKVLKKAVNNYKMNNNELLKVNEKLEDELSQAATIDNKTSISAFRMGDRSISTEHLLEIVNSTLKENIKLQMEINRKEDLLNFVRKSYGLKIEDRGHEYSISFNEDSVLKEVNENLAKLQKQVNTLTIENDKNKYLLKFIENRYGLKSSYADKEGTTEYTLTILPFTRIDSAITLYPHYKHKLIKNKKGELDIK